MKHLRNGFLVFAAAIMLSAALGRADLIVDPNEKHDPQPVPAPSSSGCTRGAEFAGLLSIAAGVFLLSRLRREGRAV